jgi:predicted nucleic acid-binding protein
LVDLQPEARAWLGAVATGERRPSWPAHLYVEIGHVLVRYVRTGRADPGRASAIYTEVRRIRAGTASPRALEFAMAVALERGLTVYDAAYVVLAEALDAPLVTADRQLADATEQAILLPG